MIQAVSDRIILIPDPIQESIGGVLIPETSLTKPIRGRVVSVGVDVREIKSGYEVYYLKGNGAQVEDKLIITERDILGYVSDDKLMEEIELLIKKHNTNANANDK